MLTTKKLTTIIMAVGLVITLTACQGSSDTPQTGSDPSASEMVLATTTSTENSGLLDFILPNFTAQYGIDVKVVAVGSGAALQMGVDGEADVLLAHAKTQEEALVAEGHGLERFDVMYNDFIIIGPAEDPAGLSANAGSDVVAAFRLIADTGSTFVSRGDSSGTHIMEINLWKEMGMEEPTDRWYVSAGQGMGDVIIMANEMGGYTLTDRATYLSMMKHINMEILVEGDAKLYNQYGVIAVNPEKGGHINGAAAERFVHWILSDETQNLISEFGLAEFGMPLFFPNAQ